MGVAVYGRYDDTGEDRPTSYLAHIGGSGAGLTLGLVVLKVGVKKILQIVNKI